MELVKRKDVMQKVKFLLLFLLSLICIDSNAQDFPIVYIESPISGPRPRINDIAKPMWTEPGSKLVYRDSDGNKEVLVDPSPDGGILDPAVSLDGKWVYYTLVPDSRPVFYNPVQPSDIYKINIETKEIIRLTHSEYTPVGDSNTPPQIHNVGACPIPGGKVIFESSRNQLRSARDDSSQFFWEPLLQLFVMDEDGSNVEQVGYLNLGGSRHPTLMKDGRIMWSSGEFHGLRNHKLWGLWASKPDGRQWEPLFSAFMPAVTLTSFHWQSQSPNGHVQLCWYYPIQQSGYGNMMDFMPGQGFENPYQIHNTIIRDDRVPQARFPLQPKDVRSLTPWATGADLRGPKVSQPSAAPGGLVLSYGITNTEPPDETGLGSTMGLKSGGIYFLPDAKVTEDPSELIKIIDDPNVFETQPRAVVPIEEIYGEVPPELSWIPNKTSTPFGWVGTSGVYARESAHLNRHLYTGHTPDDLWGQGGDVGTFENSDIDKIRILLQLPSPKKSDQLKRGKTWQVEGVERMAVAGEIPLRKHDDEGNLILDSAGDPDTSFLAKIPADHSFTFQLIDKNGQVLTHAMTWHQVRPGERRTDCRGCHAHHEPGIVFEGTEASKPGFDFADLTLNKPMTVEYVADVKPIFEEHCSGCHGEETQEANLNLLDPTIRNSEWVLPFRSRQSKIMLRLLSHDENVRMPLGNDPLSPEEIRTVATWIDLGASWDEGGKFHIDNQRPTLYINSPQSKQLEIDKIQFGAFEWQGNIENISVKASWDVNGVVAGEELVGLFNEVDHVWTLPLEEKAQEGIVTIEVTDNSNRTAKLVRKFVSDTVVEPPDPPESSDLEERVTDLENRVDNIDQEINNINQNIEEVEEGLNSLQQRIESLEHKLNTFLEALKAIIETINE